jgi:hypothetical protein
MASGMEVDVSTVSLWRFNDVSGSTVPDAAGGNDLTIVGGTPATVTGITGGNARTLTSTIYCEVATPSNIQSALTATGSGWTVEAWIKPDLGTGAADKQYLWSCTGSFSLDTGTDNCIGAGYISSNGNIGLFWERNFNNSGGSSNGFNALEAAVAQNIVPQGIWTHVAWRRNVPVSSQATTDFFVNGQLVTSFPSGYIASFSPLTMGAGHYWHIGRFYRGTASEQWTDSIDEMRISNIARTDDEIRNSFQRVYGSVATGATPEITNLKPADGGQVSAFTPVSFDIITSDSVAFQKVFVWAKYASSDVVEMVYDGTAFTPFFASSSVTATTKGKHFSIVRGNGGWPSRPQISITAVTTQGKVL